MKYVFFVCVVLISTLVAAGQTRSVTNADLSKYAEQRVEADRQYIENYARLGLPSPEEIARRRERSAVEFRQYADQIRQRDAEVERLAAEWRAQQRAASSQIVVVTGGQGYGDPGYFYSGGWWGGNFVGRGNRQPYSQPGYYAGGQFWPTGGATPSRPMFGAPRPMIGSPRH